MLQYFVILLSLSFAKADIEETRDVSDFNSISVSGPFIVEIDVGQSGSESLRINAAFNDTNITDALSTTVDKNVLTVKFLWPYDIDVGAFANLIHIYITAKSVSKVSLSGSGSIAVNTPLDSPYVGIFMSGSGNVSVPVNTQTMDIVSAGAGYIVVRGSVTQLNVVASGAGNINARNLMAEKATVTIYGAGNVDLNTATMLSVTQMGSGMVRYSGDPQVNQMGIGAGGIVKMMDNTNIV